MKIKTKQKYQINNIKDTIYKVITYKKCHIGDKSTLFCTNCQETVDFSEYLY